MCSWICGDVFSVFCSLLLFFFSLMLWEAGWDCSLVRTFADTIAIFIPPSKPNAFHQNFISKSEIQTKGRSQRRTSISKNGILDLEAHPCWNQDRQIQATHSNKKKKQF